MSEVYRNIASEISADYIAWINITNPIITSSIYEAAVKKWSIIKKNYDCLLSAVENKQNFFFESKPINFKRTPWPRSQDLKPLVSSNFLASKPIEQVVTSWLLFFAMSATTPLESTPPLKKAPSGTSLIILSLVLSSILCKSSSAISASLRF